jgi:hypothetical protein
MVCLAMAQKCLHLELACPLVLLAKGVFGASNSCGVQNGPKDAD